MKSMKIIKPEVQTVTNSSNLLERMDLCHVRCGGGGGGVNDKNICNLN